MSNSHNEFITMVYFREQIQRGGDNVIYKMSTPAERLAVEKRYAILAKFLLEQNEITVRVMGDAPR